MGQQLKHSPNHCCSSVKEHERSFWEVLYIRSMNGGVGLSVVPRLECVCENRS